MEHPTSGMELATSEIADANAIATQVASDISELSHLIRALLVAIPGAKSWQRQLRLYLREIDGCMQVLRMSISMKRKDVEVLAAARELVTALGPAAAFGAMSRADLHTKSAIQIAHEIGRRIHKRLLIPQAESF